VAHIGEEFRFGLVGFLGALLLLGVFPGEFGKLAGLPLQFGLRAFQVDHIGGEPQVIVDQALLMLLDLGDVGADRDIAAVLGAPLANIEPGVVLELYLEGARAGHCGVVSDAAAQLGHAADFGERLVGCAGYHRRVRQLVQALEVRVAQHEAVFGVPQHEGFGNGLDRIAQPQVRLDAAFGEAALFGDVDRDADQVMAAVAMGGDQFAAHPQPDPVPGGMLHAERAIDLIDFAAHQLVGQLQEIDVLGLHQSVHLAEGEQVAAALQPQHGEHRLRPENPAARQIPVPQSAAAAVERGVDAPAHGVVDQVAFPRAARLPVEGEAENQHDKAGGGRERNLQRGVGAPQRFDTLLHDDDAARQRGDGVLDRHGPMPIRQRQFRDDVLRRLRGLDRIEQDVGRHHRIFAGEFRENALPVAADHDLAARCDPPGRHQRRQQQLQLAGDRVAILMHRPDAFDPLGQHIRQRGDLSLHRSLLLPGLIRDLHERADADGSEEGDDEGGDGPAQHGFCDQQALISGLRDRLCQSLDRIGLDTRARNVRTRHAFAP